MKTVLLVVAQKDYQPVEYANTKKVLEELGVKVLTVGNQLGMAHSTQNYNSAEINLTLEQVDVGLFGGLFFVGGPGALEYLDNEVSYNLLRKWRETGKPYGAICISPRILAKAGVLKDKKATGWNGDKELEDVFSRNNVNYVPDSVVVDGNVVTADGPMVAEEFGKKIVEVLEK